MLRNVCLLVALAASVTAAPSKKCEPVILCIDGMTECGVPWGGCYDTCYPERAPKPPPCEDDCSTRTICVDAINECGMMYGGCFPDCRPWPLTKPPCPEVTKTPSAVYATPTAA
ncbi:hypothetical protein BKA56DRAFT_581718 [Ilyonectria sp. MPI-CAGE-AT-0026]|nr:hypothetical protein BKA56DRAFT_581718 [Ilyonectria sp. MPI-CAGE-AT-0026]